MSMRRLILAGAGHAHARVLMDMAQRPVADLEIVLVSPVSQAPYSGMVPGWIAGQYRWEECCIDFVRLCERASARLCLASLTGLDIAHSRIVLDDGEHLPYDWLSLDVGSTLHPPESDVLEVLPMRPLATLNRRWDALLRRVTRLPAGTRFRMLVLGGGAAGVESALAAWEGLRRAAPNVELVMVLATQGHDLVAAMASGSARRLERHFSCRGIEIVRGFSASHIVGDAVVAADGRKLHGNVALWATGAQAHAWPMQAGLPVDERGFICIDRCLRVPGVPNVFASGDCASWQPPLPKAGVFAVRMGPVLAHNLRALVQGTPLCAYRPQRRHLVLLRTGDQNAVASWGPLSWQGKHVWLWKDRIDRRFLARYNDL